MFKKQLDNIILSYNDSQIISSKTLTKSPIKTKSISPIKTRPKLKQKSIIISPIKSQIKLQIKSQIRADRSHKSENDRIYDKFACQVKRITGKTMCELDIQYGSDIRRGAIKLLMFANYPNFEIFDINYYGNIIAENIPDNYKL
jgi:hypothetical protein